MPKVKINGKEYEFPDGINALEACKQVGVYVPHFCYHPLLKVVGSCRMCKVEVTQEVRGQMMSRIDISCRLPIADGMEIDTQSPKVKKAQQMTLEFLLSNHPLDCPICDDAGECELQNYYFEYGQHQSRQRELKIHKRKAFDIGKSIVLDSERCVLCSRCVRFLDEITHTHELGIFGMGSSEELMLKPGAKLDNDYAGNVVDLCPVGALTDKDFRFKRRVWYLKSTPSICQLCSRGCNVRIDWDIDPFHDHKKSYQMKTYRTDQTTQQRIQRIKPRENFDVNGTWICDHGRYGYRPTDAEDRFVQPVMRKESGLEVSPPGEAVSAMADGLKKGIKSHKTAVVISPELTNEEVFAVWTLFTRHLACKHLDHRIPVDPSWYGDNILRTPDPFPNRMGCEWIGFQPDEKSGIGVDNLNEAIINGKIDTLVSILAAPHEFLEDESLKKLKNKYALLRNIDENTQGYIDIALPAAAWGEYKGTFINFEGRIQKLEAALSPLGEAKPVWFWMDSIATTMKKSLNWNSAEDILHKMSEQIVFFKGITFSGIPDVGKLIGDNK